MKRLFYTFLWSLPILILLAVAIFSDTFLGRIWDWITFPGMLLIIILRPSWETVHNISSGASFVANAVIYYLVILAVLASIDKMKQY